MFLIGQLWLLTLYTIVLASSPEVFDESLKLKSLNDGRVAATFTFKTTLAGASPRNPSLMNQEDESQHYTVFPLALGQILREWAVSEIHLTVNSGKWNYEHWGLPEESGVASGAELWAWMADGANTTVDERWRGLRNSLAGLFCASLGSMDELRTTSPRESFLPEGHLPDWGVPHQVRHASLPSERVCTENLTPYLKLLPCKSLSGIASLLNPHRLFDADWHGLGVHVSWHEEIGIQLRLSFMSVFNPLRSGIGRKQDWSFKSLFDRTIDQRCPVAERSEILVSLPKDKPYSLRPDASYIQDPVAVFDVNSVDKPLNIGLIWAEPVGHEDYLSESVPISVSRSLKGSSQSSGQLVVTVTNHRDEALQALYLETMPWLVQFQLHTMQTKIGQIIRDDIVSNITYILPIPHSRPTTLQALLTLPPHTTVHLTMDVTKAFLRYTEHPPDAQRGWDLPPAIFTLLRHSNDSSTNLLPAERIYTPTLLVDLATPDFSMPYNVIIFSCSLIAFLFGSIFNLLTRRFVVVALDKPKTE